MSPSAKPLVILAGLSMAIIGASLLLRQNTNIVKRDPAPSAEIPSESGEVDLRKEQQTASRSFKLNSETTRTQGEVTTGVKTLALQTPAALPPLTGYVLDQFATWNAVPAGYHADNIAVRNGAISLTGDSQSTEPRTGILLSPALPLKAPALAAPAANVAPLPEGASVLLEISLAEDGITWSPWAMAQRYSPPDGKRVSAPLQAQISTTEIAAREVITSAPVSGPAIRYRLTLEASSVTSPQVADVRIWKQEYQ